MDKSTRRYLFYALVILFPFLGAAVVFYAQGWRLDIGTFNIEKIGAVYIKSLPKYADIKLNDKPIENKSGILDSGTFIDNLFPKNYKLTLSAEGYLDWEEHVEVRPSLVSEIKHAVLVPKTAKKVITESAKNFWNIGGLLLKNERGELVWDSKKLSGSRLVDWNDNSQKILTEDEKNKIYFLNDISTASSPAINLSRVLVNSNIKPVNVKKILIDPANDNNLIIQTANSIFLLDVPAENITTVGKSSSTLVSFTASTSWLAWTTFNQATGLSRLTIYDRFSGGIKNEEVVVAKNGKIAFRDDNELGLFQNNGDFYIKRINENRLDKLASGAKDFFFSKETDGVAILGNESVEIFSSGPESGYWRFRLPEVSKIERLEWYQDGSHLFVIYPDEAKFLDLNDESLENFPSVISGNPIRYNRQSNTLYALKNNEIWALTMPK